MVFQLARTFKKPSATQRGFPAPGAGPQTVGDYTPSPGQVPLGSNYPIQGDPTWGDPSYGGQQGFPAPLNGAQRRPKGSMPNVPPVSGEPIMVWTPYYDRGAAAYVPNYGKVLTNPIGAGVVARYRPQASYGPAAQYANGAIWWTSQAIPTSVNLQGLTDPSVLAAVLGPVNVLAAVRTTG